MMIVYGSCVIFLSLCSLKCLGLEVFYNIKSPNCGARDLYTPGILDDVIDLRRYGLNTTTMTSFQFEVKACAEVSVYATNKWIVPLSTEIYNVYIGGNGNDWAKLRRRKQDQAWDTFEHTGAFLKCTEFVPFWFSWMAGNIENGLGNNVGSDNLLKWDDPDLFNVNGLAISTSYGQTGEWKIKIDVQCQFTGFFSRCGESTKTDVLSLDMYSVTLSMCAAECSAFNDCYGLNYHIYARKCELLLSGGGPLMSIRFVNVTGWNFYAKCYRGKEVCVGCFFVE